MGIFVKRYHKIWSAIKTYFELSAQGTYLYPYQSCSGFMNFVYCPVKMPQACRKKVMEMCEALEDI